MGHLGSVRSAVLEDELVDRKALVLPSSENPYGLGLTLRGFVDRGPDITLVYVDLPGLREVEVGAPGMAVVELELY